MARASLTRPVGQEQRECARGTQDREGRRGSHRGPSRNECRERLQPDEPAQQGQADCQRRERNARAAGAGKVRRKRPLPRWPDGNAVDFQGRKNLIVTWAWSCGGKGNMRSSHATNVFAARHARCSSLRGQLMSIRKSLALALSVAGGLILLVAGALFWVESESGQRFIERRASATAGREVTIGELDIKIGWRRPARHAHRWGAHQQPAGREP